VHLKEAGSLIVSSCSERMALFLPSASPKDVLTSTPTALFEGTFHTRSQSDEPDAMREGPEDIIGA